MKKLLLATVALLPNMAMAQTDMMQSFDEARREMLNDYKGFRKSVLDSYADYLEQVWKEYRTFKGEVRDAAPKPKEQPDARETPAAPPRETVPTVETPPVAVTPKPEMPEPRVEPMVTVPAQQTSITFYGVRVKAPVMRTVGVADMTPEEVAEAWRTYSGNGMVQKAKNLAENARALGLNDWFTYEYVRESVEAQCKGSGEAERAVLMHFLLANMGYDVRLAVCQNAPCLLLAIEQQVYGRGYMQMDGRKYYIYKVDGSAAGEGGSLYTCQLPEGMDAGRPLDMRIRKEMRVRGGEKHRCTLEYGGMEVTAEVDVAMMEMLRHYPQMDIAQYAMSDVCPGLRRSVLNQLAGYIQGMTKVEAAQKLLRFTQLAFAYATDGEQHGYEKAYFFEENFYYPKNDCEDRAIFYAYIVKNLLGLDVHLVNFPGHECTAVNFGDANVRGAGYVCDGKTYIICDPTYIGASIGDCMPQYRNVTPKAERWD